MSEHTLTSPDYHVRRRHYVDRNVQGRLIAGLILVEVLLFAVAMWFVYMELQTTIDQELYRVHQAVAQSGPVLLYALYKTIPWIILVNLVVLIGIDRVWGRYINLIIEKLRRAAQKVAVLDLRDHLTDTEHDVLRQARQWIESEHTRCVQIRELVQMLPTEVSEMDPGERQRLIEQLQQIRNKLP